MPISNLNLASPTAVGSALSNMVGHLNTRDAWLDNSNKYIGEAFDVIKQDLLNGTLNNQELSDYIAASICIHCSNGWSYLSTAVSSLLEGDYAGAVHNAYYAELRAIMAFLAIQGIGVFNNQHILIDANGHAVKADLQTGTHVFAKEAFDQWLYIPANLTLVFRAMLTPPLESLDQ